MPVALLSLKRHALRSFMIFALSKVPEVSQGIGINDSKVLRRGMLVPCSEGSAALRYQRYLE